MKAGPVTKPIKKVFRADTALKYSSSAPPVIQILLLRQLSGM
jgi:hypothetical protein